MAGAGWGLAFKLPWVALVEKLPAWIVSRFYSKEKAADRFDVDLKSTDAVSISLGSMSELQVRLRVLNRNPFPIHVYRIHILDIWFGQPILKDINKLDEVTVPANSVLPPYTYGQGVAGWGNPRLSFDLELTEAKLRYIGKQIRDGQLQNDPTISMEVYARCAVGEFVKEGIRFDIPRHQVGGIPNLALALAQQEKQLRQTGTPPAES